MATTAVPSRFPRVPGALDKLASLPSRALTSTGKVSWFAIEAIKEIAHALRYYRKEIVRLIAETGMGAGAMAVVGGTVAIVGFVTLSAGSLIAIQGFASLGNIGVAAFTGFFAALANIRVVAPVVSGTALAATVGAGATAELGAMRISEEIDALRTWGIDPMEFLVLPRMIALVVMMPLLTLYADLIGIMGGAFIGVGMFDIAASQYIEQTLSAVTLTQFAIGLAKSVVFGMIIAVSGCFYGMRCGRSASAVGEAATRSVVSGIVFIVVADGVFAVITNALWI